MNRTFIKLFFCLCIVAALPSYAYNTVHYYFRTVDIRNGLSQNSVNQIFQDRKGFMWFGTKDGLNRYDGLFFRVYNNKNSNLGRNFITALYEDAEGNIWVGTDGGVFIYNPVLDSFTPFNRTSDKGTVIRDFVTMIKSDERNNIWISVEYQGLFCYNNSGQRLQNYLHEPETPNVTRFWLSEDTFWLALHADNLYYAKAGFETLHPFKDADGNEIFKDDIINCQINGPYNCIYVASFNGLTEINFTNGKTRKLLDAYVRTLQFKSDDELWAGTETGLYIYNLTNDRITHLTVPEQDDSYALSDNAIYSIYRDRENGMWVGTFSGGLNKVNLHTRQVKHYSKGKDENSMVANDVFTVCKTTTGDIWIGTTSGLMKYNRSSDNFMHIPQLGILFIYDILEDFNGNLWFATFSNGIFCYNTHTKQWKSYLSDEKDPTSLAYNKVISIYEDSKKRLWFMTMGKGFCRYNPETDNFTRYDTSNGLPNNTVYKMVEDKRGNLWVTSNYGLVCFDPQTDAMHIYTRANGLLSNLPLYRLTVWR